jgi:hypothetical protein
MENVDDRQHALSMALAGLRGLSVFAGVYWLNIRAE